MLTVNAANHPQLALTSLGPLLAVLSYWDMLTLNADHHPHVAHAQAWSAARAASAG